MTIFAIDDELGDDDEFAVEDELGGWRRIDDELGMTMNSPLKMNWRDGEFAIDDELGDDDEFAIDVELVDDDEFAIDVLSTVLLNGGLATGGPWAMELETGDVRSCPKFRWFNS
jgi:hypothetical protein